MRVESPPGFQAFSADGTSFGAFGANHWFFEIGTFQDGFEPTRENWMEWREHWTVAHATTWFTAGPLKDSVRTEFVQDNPELTGRRGYVWAYDAVDTSPAMEWALISNNNWSFPPPDFMFTTEWNIADSDSVMVGFGSYFGENGQFSGMQTEVVPEPAAYGFVVGVVLLGFARWRRR